LGTFIKWIPTIGQFLNCRPNAVGLEQKDGGTLDLEDEAEIGMNDFDGQKDGQIENGQKEYGGMHN
jgi:hypothetical protein